MFWHPQWMRCPAQKASRNPVSLAHLHKDMTVRHLDYDGQAGTSLHGKPIWMLSGWQHKYYLFRFLVVAPGSCLGIVS